LTRYGVPDDEMPDNPLPPWWGPAPFDERDLDAVLSGETIDIPVALRPVADALAALQAAPMPAELRGQAIIMAEFRALTEFRAAALAQDERAGDAARTLALFVPPEHPARRSAPRHRGRRRTTPVANWRTGTLISATAVAAVVLAVVLTGNVPGPFRGLVGPSAVATSASQNAGGNSSSPKVEATSASKEPTATPTAGGSAPSQQSEDSRLCHEVYGIIKDPGPSARWKQDASSLSSLLHQLSKLAGGYRQVPGLCEQYLGDMFPDGTLPGIPSSGDQGPGSGQDNQGGVFLHL
jgi:hypothetical protein